MSGFIDYFKSLGMPYIRKAGGVNEGIVRTAANLLDDAKDDIKWLRYQFFPQLCQTELLDEHAKCRGIERYVYESDDFYRNRIANAYQYFLRGGTQAGVNEFLESIGLDASVVEYHNYTGSPEIGWAEFIAQVDMDSLDQNTTNRQFLAKLLNELKPARSRLAFIKWRWDSTQFTVPPAEISLEITFYIGFQRCNGIAARSFHILGWGCRLLDGTWNLDGGWGDLEIIDH